MWHMLQKMMYVESYNISDDNIDVSNIPLDPITVARQADLRALHHCSSLDFVRRALAQCLDRRTFDDFVILEKILVPTEINTSSSKWSNHINALVEYRVLREVHLKEVLHTSRYFAVSKSGGVARTIFNGRVFSKKCYPPRTVNLMPIDDLIRKVAQITQDGKKLSVVIADIRHWFHQLWVTRNEYFGICCDGKYYLWDALPMGWSHSPRISQCIAWGIILFVESNERRMFSTPVSTVDPPQFLSVLQNDEEVGFITLLYDNIGMFCVSDDIAEKVKNRLDRNFERFKVKLKYNRHYSAKRMNVNSPLFDGPIHLGVQYSCICRVRKTFVGWRHDPAKCDGWRSALLNSPVCTSVSIARAIGIIIWDATISLKPLCRLGAILAILSRVAKLTEPTRIAWRLTTHTLNDDERASINLVLSEVLANAWRFNSTTVCDADTHAFLATDACTSKGWGFVHLSETGKIVQHASFAWKNDNVFGNVIFVQEIAAAVWALEIVCEANPRIKRVTLVVDNVAAYYCIRRWYSNNHIACTLLSRSFEKMSTLNVAVDVMPILGSKNVADGPSRLERPLDVRREETWKSIMLWRSGLRCGEEDPTLHRIRHLDAELNEIDDEGMSNLNDWCSSLFSSQLSNGMCPEPFQGKLSERETS